MAHDVLDPSAPSVLSGSNKSLDPALLRVGLLHLTVVYLAWGSTFLGIRFAVQGEGHFQPFTLAACRLTVASAILFFVSYLNGAQPFRLSRDVWWRLALSGLLLWVGGHALLIWAAQWADSGFGAALFASIPLWTALIDAVRFPKYRSVRHFAPVLMGFFGIVLISVPQIAGSVSPSAAAPVSGRLMTIVILISAAAWAFGSTLHNDEMDHIPATLSAAWQQFFAALFCVGLALTFGEVWTTPSPQAVGAFFYLVAVGSVFAFTSYVRALQILPNQLVASFAYVNPLIAICLGAIISHEPITSWTVGGMAVVVASVLWLFRETRREHEI